VDTAEPAAALRLGAAQAERTAEAVPLVEAAERPGGGRRGPALFMRAADDQTNGGRERPSEGGGRLECWPRGDEGVLSVNESRRWGMIGVGGGGTDAWLSVGRGTTTWHVATGSAWRNHSSRTVSVADATAQVADA